MKAYKNSEGSILAVFKDDRNKYGVYIRKSEGDKFVRNMNVKYPSRATREEAEQDLRVTAKVRSYDDTWELIDFKG